MSQTLKTRSGRTITLASPEEDAAITAAAAADPDALPLTDEEWERVRPLAENPKVFTGICLDPDILAAFKNSGRGWQTRMNDALRDWLRTHQPG